MQIKRQKLLLGIFVVVFAVLLVVPSVKASFVEEDAVGLDDPNRVFYLKQQVASLREELADLTEEQIVTAPTAGFEVGESPLVSQSVLDLVNKAEGRMLRKIEKLEERVVKLEGLIVGTTSKIDRSSSGDVLSDCLYSKAKKRYYKPHHTTWRGMSASERITYGHAPTFDDIKDCLETNNARVLLPGTSSFGGAPQF